MCACRWPALFFLPDGPLIYFTATVSSRGKEVFQRQSANSSYFFPKTSLADQLDQLLALFWTIPSSLVAQTVKASAYNAGDLGSIPGLGRSSGEGNGTPLQYSWVENPTDREAWKATIHGVAKCQTWLSDFTFFLDKSVETTWFPFLLSGSILTELFLLWNCLFGPYPLILESWWCQSQLF